MSFKLNQSIVKKILEVVDAGLTSGLGTPIPGNMCVEAAVCYALGLDHSDDPRCVDYAVRALKISINDANWSNRESRALGLRKLAILQLGTLGTLDFVIFSKKTSILSQKYAKSAAKSAESAAKYAESAAKSAAKYAEYAAEYDSVLSIMCEVGVQALKAAGAKGYDLMLQLAGGTA